MKVEGPLSFELTGIMASVAGPLAEAGISMFTIGTYETDYILIKKEGYEEAVGVLRGSGHKVKRLANETESNV